MKSFKTICESGEMAKSQVFFESIFNDLFGK